MKGVMKLATFTRSGNSSFSAFPLCHSFQNFKFDLHTPSIAWCPPPLAVFYRQFNFAWGHGIRLIYDKRYFGSRVTDSKIIGIELRSVNDWPLRYLRIYVWSLLVNVSSLGHPRSDGLGHRLSNRHREQPGFQAVGATRDRAPPQAGSGPPAPSHPGIGTTPSGRLQVLVLAYGIPV